MPLCYLSSKSKLQLNNSNWHESIGMSIQQDLWNQQPQITQTFQLLDWEKKSTSWSVGASWMRPNTTLGAKSPAEGNWAGTICFGPADTRQTIILPHPPPAALRVIIHHEADGHCPLAWHAVGWLAVHNWRPEICLGLNTIHLSVTHKGH